MTPAPAPASASIKPPWLVGILLAQAVWLGWFLLEPLPGVAGAQLRRFDLLLNADGHFAQAVGNLSHLANLAERLPILGTALLIAAASLAVGGPILTWIGVSPGNRTSRAEWVALGFGVGTTVLGGLTLILGRWVGLNPWGVRGALGVLIVVGMGVGVWLRGRSPGGNSIQINPSRWSIGQMVGFAVIVGPFLLVMGLGAMLPTIEFDALEYHLQAPKEYFLDGRVEFLPHNVYASMPAGVEMLTTLAMEVLGDWWLGGLAGQELIAWFAPATAVLIAGSASRIAGTSRAGWFAALVYLTTPWVCRVANTPFVEGPLCFFHAALIWAWVRSELMGSGNETTSPRPVRWGLLVGFLAGGGLAIKYPALVSAVVPAALVVGFVSIRTRSARPTLDFVIGVVLVVAPWLIKNQVETGNPVYPLGWSVFGGTEWDSAREAQWQAAHGPKPITANLLGRSVLDVLGRSDWQSPLYAALVPLAWFGTRHRRASRVNSFVNVNQTRPGCHGIVLHPVPQSPDRADSRGGVPSRGTQNETTSLEELMDPGRMAIGLAVFAVYLFATWWLLTHRLDRFWLPMLPPLAILAGLGAGSLWASSRGAAVGLITILAVGVGANATLCSTELCGPTAWTTDLATIRDATARDGTPSLARLDEALPPDARPLAIGQAGTFGLRHRPVYNTVFNRDLFERIVGGKPHLAVISDLHRRGITHVYVDWAEIDRYRQPGNYGFSTFETPEVFEGLVQAGVLGPGVRIGTSQILYKVQ